MISYRVPDGEKMQSMQQRNEVRRRGKVDASMAMKLEEQVIHVGIASIAKLKHLV